MAGPIKKTSPHNIIKFAAIDVFFRSIVKEKYDVKDTGYFLECTPYKNEQDFSYIKYFKYTFPNMLIIKWLRLKK